MHLANTTTIFSNQPMLALSLCNKVEQAIRKGDRMGWMPIETIADINAGIPCSFVLKSIVAQLPNDNLVVFFGVELVGEIVEYVNKIKP